MDPRPFLPETPTDSLVLFRGLRGLALQGMGKFEGFMVGLGLRVQGLGFRFERQHVLGNDLSSNLLVQALNVLNSPEKEPYTIPLANPYIKNFAVKGLRVRNERSESSAFRFRLQAQAVSQFKQ